MKVERKKDIKFLVLFIIVIVIAFIYLSQASLAKYRKQTEGNLEGTVAHWNIKLNGEDIHREMTNIITPVINESNYTKTGVVAPGTTGYFNLAIDATDVDVDFTYTISFESLNSLEDIKVTSYEINNDGITHNVTDTVTGDIVHNTTTTNIKCNFEWYDGVDNVMDNHDDTETAKNSTTADIKVIINFVQKQE